MVVNMVEKWIFGCNASGIYGHDALFLSERLENRQIDEQRIISVFSIFEWAEVFIVNRKARGLSPNTIVFY